MPRRRPPRGRRVSGRPRQSKPKKEKSVSKRAHDRAVARIRTVVGSTLFLQAETRYGRKKIDDLAQVLARNLSVEKQKVLRKSRHGDFFHSLTDTDKARFKVLKEINRPHHNVVQFFRRRDGKYLKVVGGRRRGVVSAKAKERYESFSPYRKLLRLVEGVLDLSPKEARRLIKDTAEDARKQLRKFKRSKKYKRMSAKRKRRYNAERTTIAALLRLQYILTGDSGVTGHHRVSREG